MAQRVLLIALLLTAARAASQVPAPLQPWEAWVLADEPFRACPVLTGRMPGDPAHHVCAWPGELSIDAGARGGRFAQSWRLYQEDWLALPGSAAQWPVDVRLNGQRAAVVNRAGQPSLHLPAGEYRISGAWRWGVRPASLAIPAGTGLIQLTVDGDSIAAPEVADGRVWLGERAAAQAAEDRLTLGVYRLLTDTLPVILTTRIDLQVSGRAREVVLPAALLTGFKAQQLVSPLPVVIDEAGLKAQLRPGRFQILLTSRAAAIPATLPVPSAAAPWPAEEIWSFAADPRLRVATLEGAPAVDAAQVGAPPEWRNLPTYQVTGGSRLELVERSRGQSDVGNRLQLARDLWWDFNGRGLTARDQITGRQRAGRLDMAPPYRLTSARSAAESLLITDGSEPGTRGVELRAAELQLQTSARIDGRVDVMPVTGYLDRFESVSASLQLPPGYRLLAANGADQAPQAWVNQWRLLDIFLLLIICVAAVRLLGPTAGAIALGALALTFHEPNSLSWSWLWLLVAVALFRIAPEGRLRHWAQRLSWASAAVVVVLLLPFAATQLKLVLFPQLEADSLVQSMADLTRPPATTASAPRAVEEALMKTDRGRTVQALESDVSTPRRAASGYQYTRYLPGAQVQTGPGLPDWQWRAYQLSWDGPVDAQETLGLMVAGPGLVRVLRLLGVLFCAALLLITGAAIFGWPRGWPRLPGITALLPALLLLGSLLPAPGFTALPVFPSPALLDELKQRLTKPAPCRPDCADVMEAAVAVTPQRLTIQLEVALAQASAVPLPGKAGDWEPLITRVNERPAAQLWRGADGRLWLPLDSGVARLELSGSLRPGASVTVPFPLQPRHIEVAASGWQVVGVRDGQLPSSALELIPAAVDGEVSEGSAPAFEPFVRVTRELRLDLDWTIVTRAERIAPVTGPFTLELDLLAEESVVSDAVQVSEGRVQAAFAANQQVFAWQSLLPRADQLRLVAPVGEPWSEVWRVRLSPLWHGEASGLPETAPLNIEPDFYVPEYYPRPGETLTLAISRPAASAGETLAFDRVALSTRLGQRVDSHDLTLKYRSSRGTRHPVMLPGAAELSRVSIDGQAVPLALLEGRLELPITPGEHTVAVEFSTAASGGLRQAVGPVDLGLEASNVRLSLTSPGDRWVLLTFGPGLGPAILYWSELLVFILLAITLGRMRQSPFKVHEWLLLGLGLSTFAWPVLILFAAWAFIMAWRAEMQPGPDRLRFNALQVVLAIFSLLAVGALLGAIPTGLLGRPDMQVASPLGYGEFIWFVDRSGGQLPAAGVLSVSLWFYKAAMLAWALWLSFALVRWMPWAWRCFVAGGLWRGRVQPTV